jgi:hypothetical protein
MSAMEKHFYDVKDGINFPFHEATAEWIQYKTNTYLVQQYLKFNKSANKWFRKELIY